MANSAKWRLRLFTVGGTVMTTDYASVILVASMIVTLRFRLFPFFYDNMPGASYWIMAVMTTVGFVLSVLAHEMAHVLTAKGAGGAPPRLRLGLFGAVRDEDSEYPRPSRGIYSAGIAVSFSLAAALFALAFIYETNAPGQVITGILFHVACANVSLAVFQLLPALPLDGGKILTGYSSRDTRAGFFYLGNFIGLILVTFGIYHYFRMRPAVAVWMVIVGVLLLKANIDEYRHLRRPAGAGT